MSPRASGGTVFGIALTPGSIAAAGAAMPTVWERALELNGGANGSIDLLRDALAEAARSSGLGAPSAVIALMPPLTETRTVPLPPLGEDDRNRFLARNAARYFVGARGPQVVGTLAPRAVTRGDGELPVLAAAAAQQLLHALHVASTAAGVPVIGVVPAESAWAAAAVELWPSLARGSGALAVCRDDRTDLLSLADGQLTAVRRFRGVADAAAIATASAGGSGGARVGVLGAPDTARALAEALASRGVRVLVPDPAWGVLGERPELLAARFAPLATALVVRTEESRERDRVDAGRAAWWLAGIAALLLIGAALVHVQGARRELASIQAARAAIRPQVEATLVGRTPIDAAYRQVAALSRATREAPRWSAVLATLTQHLPDDASLTAFRARGDSVFLDGVADRASPVFDAIARAPGITGVRATAPVRREAIEGEVPLEHFALGAQLAGRRR